MKNWLFYILLTLILGMQGLTLYRQYAPVPRPGRDQSPIQDASGEMDLSALPVLGSVDAQVAMVEFSDFECPFCERFTKDVAPTLKRNFVSSGKLRYFFANNPLPTHGSAKLLATAAICVGESHFWEMHDRIFSEKPREVGHLTEIARSLDLDRDDFRKCIDNGAPVVARLKVEMETAERLGLRATPAFVIGVIKGERLVIQKIVLGAQSPGVFEETINDVLASLGN